MTDKQQIEEMAKAIERTGMLDSFSRCEVVAEELHADGYCKQREGENISTVHPVDEFICSNCGIALEGWTKVVTDEDDGEQYHYEYAFKHCPECGAKVKGE